MKHNRQGDSLTWPAKHEQSLNGTKHWQLNRDCNSDDTMWDTPRTVRTSAEPGAAPRPERRSARTAAAAVGRSAALPTPSGHSRAGRVAREALSPVEAVCPAQGSVVGARTETQGFGRRCGRRWGRWFSLSSPAPRRLLCPRSRSLPGAAPRPSRRGAAPYLQGPSPPNFGTRLLRTPRVWFPCCCVGSRM